MKVKLIAVLILGAFAWCGTAEMVQNAGRQQFRWGDDGRLLEYRIGDVVYSSAEEQLFSALDAMTGRLAGFSGEMTPGAEGDLVYRAAAPELELELEAHLRSRSDGFLEVELAVINCSELPDRAIELRFALPLTAANWNFAALEGSDRVSGAIPARPGVVYEELRSIDNARFSMQLSRLPFVAADNGEAGVMLAHPLQKPHFFRYHFVMEEGNQGCIGFRVPLGVSADTGKFPDRAEVTFLVGDFDGTTHLRGALARYHEHAPEIFESHIGYPGAWALWIPEFTMEQVRECGMGFNLREWDEDFGRDPEEAVRILDASQRLGIKTLLYSEPWSITLPFPAGWDKENEDDSVLQLPDQKRIRLGAEKEFLNELQGDANPTERFRGPLTNDELYRILQNTAIEINENGDWRLNCYWPGQFVWGKKYYGQDSAAVIVNPDPDLPLPNRSTITFDRARYGYTLEQLAQHGRSADGFYIDSESFSMGWSECNLRRSHWQVADLPLTYASFVEDGKLRVFQHMILAYNDFLEDIRQRADALDYCIATNTWTHFVHFLVPYADLVGAGEFFTHEWIAPLADFREFRYAAGRKLISTMDYVLNFEGGVPETAEAVMKYIEPRLNYYLLYGIYPGTANSWNRPERIRLVAEALKRYTGWTTLINQAGWQELPLTAIDGADADNVLIERWGSTPETGLYFTLRSKPVHIGNVLLEELPSWPSQTVSLSWNPADFGVSEFSQIVDLVSGNEFPVESRDGKAFCTVEIPGSRTLLLSIR